MELKYLKTLKVILETGSFQKAAEHLHYAQSTITTQMQFLEQELSIKLFERVGRRMVLTQQGEGLLPYVDQVLNAVERMENYSQSEKQLSGTLKIALPETLLTYQMSKVMKAFKESAPHVKLSLQTSNCYEIRNQIINGNVDLGIHYDIGGYGSSLIVNKLNRFPLVLAGNPMLNDNEKDFMTSHQKKDICLLSIDKESLYEKIFQHYLRSMDICLDSEMEIGSSEAVKRCIIGNIGVSYLPRFTIEEELKNGDIISLPTKITNQEILVVYTYHKNKWITPAMDLFIKLLKDELSSDN